MNGWEDGSRLMEGGRGIGRRGVGSWWSDNEGDDCCQGRIEGEVAFPLRGK